MSSGSPGAGSPSRFEHIRHALTSWKPRIVKALLAFVAALGIAAETIAPIGNALKGQEFLGGSFAALVALILFDAVGESGQKDVSGVYVLADLDDLNASVREAFEARQVRIDFSGFSMETLLELLRPHLNRLGSRRVHTQELALRLIVAHLNLPLSLPGKLEAAPENSGYPAGTLLFRDSPENRQRIREEFTRPNWMRLKRLLDLVHEQNPHIAISCEVRESPQVPERKLYILNQEKVFSVPYGIREASVEWRGETFQILDTEGFGLIYGNARIIGWDRRSTSRSTREIAEHHMEWHRNLWDKLEYIKPEDPVIADPRWVGSRRPRGTR
ncbi:hypothetical protein ABT301_21780 [Streptomyces sp. NPDC000987]|uniref:hypothetical protein n=1 Tax=Streptomyces sp. NPDC000987 TaxID=3154374 RepID=UPI003327F5E1